MEIYSYVGLVNVYFFISGPTSPSPWFSFLKEGVCVLEDPPRLRIGKVFSLSGESPIMVALEPVMADALPYLSNSGIIQNVRIIRIICKKLKFLDRN